MSAVATRKDIDEVIGIVRDFMTQVSEKFDRVDQRFDGVETRLDEMAQDVIDLKRPHDRLLNTVDSFISRIDRY